MKYCELCGAEGDQTVRLRGNDLMLCAYCAEPREPFPALEAFYLSAANTDSPLVKLELAKTAARYAFNQVMRAGRKI